MRFFFFLVDESNGGEGGGVWGDKLIGLLGLKVEIYL